MLFACACTLRFVQLCATSWTGARQPVRGIFQARIRERDAISSPSGSYRPRDRTHISCVSCTGRHIHYLCDNWEALNTFSSSLYIDLRFGVHIDFFLINKILLNKWKVTHLKTKITKFWN